MKFASVAGILLYLTTIPVNNCLLNRVRLAGHLLHSNIVKLQCIGAIDGSPPQLSQCYFTLNFSRMIPPVMINATINNTKEISLLYNLSPSSEAIFFCKCNSINGTISSNGIYYAGELELAENYL